MAPSLAAINNLWWHPHNFGADLNENVAFLVEILKHYAGLRDTYSTPAR
jgi:hypothetical protein